jgi:hypothetical protein
MPRDDYDDSTFLEKHGKIVLPAVLVLIGLVIALCFLFFKGKVPPPHKPDEIAVHLLPPPPLPPPPPPPPPPKITPPQQKMVELKPQDKTPPKPTPTPAPPGPPGPKASGPPSDEGIGGGGGPGGGGDGDGVGGTVFGFYAGQVGEQIRSVLSNNPKTNKATFHARLHVWLDSTGRITRVSLNHSDDDPAVDSEIKDDVLLGQDVGAPPQGMPMPIVMNIEAKRPN